MEQKKYLNTEKPVAFSIKTKVGKLRYKMSFK